MGKYFVEITSDARKDLQAHFKSGNKPIIKKIEKILLELTVTPYEGEGRPEQLKHDFSGYWSRRINQKDRLVYRVEERIVTVFIVSAMGHYNDK
ncbi:Txe/YoeB family addiction module toxin [Flavobacterium sp. MFBS3-15]|uniref:Txe/YoeB family addiction module toxin n=1 Tax=Flavobacterium sp. MFBS3-15 TaxID=2989816 RepID=UPI002235E0F8|nr:Txe/YoeB family addiction module toxin [Flavobacterium sp. MFBS3-15]MCW4470761.1 Txe/YoeB family addiction module toxin [Flavobacterium sp. MFBS3-15]